MPLPRDFAWSKFDSVPDKIGNNLTETKGVTDELVRNVCFDVVSEVEVVLRGTDDEGFEDTKDGLTDGVGDGFHGHSPGFDYWEKLLQ